MKHNILAITFPLLFLSATANAAEVYNKEGNKVDIYGRIYGLNYLNAGSGYDADGNGDKTTFRVGVQGETQIAEDLTGYGRFEYERGTGQDYITDNDSQSTPVKEETRYAYVGFSFSQWGAFDYGRNDGAVNLPLSYTDVLPEFGGDSSASNRYMSNRTDGVATYRNTDFFDLVPGLDFALQYQDANPGFNGDGYSFNVEYTLGNVSAAAAYSNSATGADNKVNNPVYGPNGGERAEMSAFALKYDDPNWYLAAMYSESRNMTYDNGFADDYQGNPANGNKTRDKVQTYELVAQYAFNFESGAVLTPSLAYLQGIDKSDNAGPNDDLFKYVDLSASYDFNKNMTALVDWKINLMDDQSDTVALGLIYRF